MHKYFSGNFESLIKWRKEQQNRNTQNQNLQSQTMTMPRNFNPTKIHPMIYLAVFVLILIAEAQGRNASIGKGTHLSGWRGNSLMSGNGTCDLTQAYSNFYMLLRSLMGSDFVSDLTSATAKHRAPRKVKVLTENEQKSINEFYMRVSKAIFDSEVTYLQELIDYGFDVTAPLHMMPEKPNDPEEDMHPLHASLLASSIETIETILDAGADPNALSYGVHPLTITLSMGRVEATQYLISRGSTFTDFEPNTKITLADSNYGVVDHQKGDPFYYPLQAVIVFEPSLVEQFIATGADLNAQDYKGMTSLHSAAAKSPNYIEILVARGANVNLPDSIGRTVLHFAVEHCPEKIEFLAKNGANLNMKDLRGYTPIKLAARLGIIKAAKILLQLGADFNKDELLKEYDETPQTVTPIIVDQKHVRSILANLRKKWVKLFEKYEDIRKKDSAKAGYLSLDLTILIPLLLGLLIAFMWLSFNRRNQQKKQPIPEKPSVAKKQIEEVKEKENVHLVEFDIEPLNPLIEQIDEMAINTKELISKRKKLIEKFVIKLKAVYDINDQIIGNKYHEHSEKNIKKFASNIVHLADQLVKEQLMLVIYNYDELTKDYLNLKKELTDLKPIHKNFISSVKGLLSSNITPEIRQNTAGLKGDITSAMATLAAKITHLLAWQTRLNKDLLGHEGVFDREFQSIENNHLSLKTALGKQERNGPRAAENVPALAPVTREREPRENRAVAAIPPQVIARAPAPPPIPAPQPLVAKLEPSKVDDRHLREKGVEITPSRKPPETPSTEYVSTPTILRKLKASASAPKNIPAPVQTNPKYKANLAEHRQAILKTLEKIKAEKLQPGTLDAEVYRYSLSFNLFQLAHNVWLFTLDIHSHWKKIPLKVQAKFLELYRVIALFRHMLAHMPVNFEMEDLISTATQFSSDDFMGIVDVVTSLKEPENLQEEELTQNNIQILKKEIEDSKLYAHLHSTKQKEQNPSLEECLLKIGYVLELTGKISKVFTTLHAFNLYADRSDAAKMLMLIAGEYSKPLDEGVRIRITKTPEYMNLKIYDLLERIYDYRNLVAHLPEELEKKVRVVTKEDLNHIVFRFTGVIEFAQNEGRLSPFIQLLLERHHTLIVLSPAENPKPATVTLSSSLAVIPAASAKLNPKAAAFVPLVHQKPAAFFPPSDTSGVGSSSIALPVQDESKANVP